MRDFPSLVRTFDRALGEHTPEWTEHNDSDPGVTMLEMLAFLAETLLVQRGAVDGGAAAAARVRKALEIYGTPAATSQEEQEAWSGRTRPRFFAGRLLTAADLDEEQRYHMDAHRRLLRMLYDAGVIDGLEVNVAPAGDAVTIAPGLAIDALGRELVLAAPATITIPPASSSDLWITIEYAERAIDHVPVATSEDGEATRIEEGCRIGFAPQPAALSIAHIVRRKNRWELDTEA